MTNSERRVLEIKLQSARRARNQAEKLQICASVRATIMTGRELPGEAQRCRSEARRWQELAQQQCSRIVSLQAQLVAGR